MVVEDSSRTLDDETAEFKAARLAPPEEQSAQHITDTETIRLDTGNLKLPKNLVGAETETARMFRPHKGVVVILGLALLFVAFIMYLISQMPVPAN